MEPCSYWRRCCCRDAADPECPHPDLCAACGEEVALYDYEERTGLDSAGRPYWRRELRLVRLCEGCIDEIASADAEAQRELEEIARSDHEQRIYEDHRDRQFMYVCRQLGMSLPKIGKVFGKRHTTVLYGIRVVEGKCLAGSEVEAAVKQIGAAARTGQR